MIKQVNPKAVRFVHGDPTALQELQYKLHKYYPVGCAVNSKQERAKGLPVWIPHTEAQEMDTEKVGVKVIDGVVYMDTDTIQSEQWQSFEEGEHTAIIKGDQLIIRKK